MPEPTSSHDEFLMWIGICITAWAKVEEFLFEICVRSLATSRERAAIVYYRTPTLDARLNLTNELVLTILPRRERKSGGHDHPKVKAWNSLRGDIGDLLKIRSRIAHHPMKAREGSIWDVPDVWRVDNIYSPSWWEIYVSDAEQLRGRDEDTKPLVVTDLVEHVDDIRKIRQRLHDFVNALPTPSE